MSNANWFRARRSKEAVGGAYDDVTFRAEGNDRHYLITRLSVIDENSAPSPDIRVHIEGHGYLHLIHEVNSPGSNTLYTISDPIRLLPGETLVARFTGATLADNLELYLEGWWAEQDPGPWWAWGVMATVAPAVT